jgi:hypothetical protein
MNNQGRLSWRPRYCEGRYKRDVRFWPKPDMTVCAGHDRLRGNPLSRSLLGAKRNAKHAATIAQAQRPRMAVPLFCGYSGQPSHTIFVYLSQCGEGHIASTRSVLAIQPREKSGCNAPKAVHGPHRDRGPPRCWNEGGRTQARLDQELFRRCQDSGAQRHEEFSERAVARVMFAFGP